MISLFLDEMLYKWTMLAWAMGDISKSYDKCSQLIFEYPSSPYAANAKKLLEKIKQAKEQQEAAREDSSTAE